MVKSPDAFRTISEVADWLGIQAHVLRFWESKFTQVKPIKRAGGRRYYRPADMLLLGGIKKLLHDDGLTIKGVQKILREEGMTHVSNLSQPLDDMPAPMEEQAAAAVPETGVVLNFASSEKASEPAEDNRSATPDFERAAPVATASEHPLPPQANANQSEPAPLAPAPQLPADDHPRATPDPLAPSDAGTEDAPRLAETRAQASEDTATAPAPSEGTREEPEATATDPASLPGFLRRPLGAEEDPPAAAKPDAQAPIAPAKAATEEDDTPRPAILDLPAFTREADFPARPGLLSRLPRVRRLPRAVQPQVAGLLLELAEMRQAMDAAAGAETNR